ncbi:hypothetical protein CHH27_20875 [Labrenzia sp. VG12]|nr:hypothetical protein CHH27_20875 [Labrenzia sp. VG12]
MGMFTYSRRDMTVLANGALFLVFQRVTDSRTQYAALVQGHDISTARIVVGAPSVVRTLCITEKDN